MKKAYKDPIVVLALLTGSQLISTLFNFSKSIALLSGLLASAYYLFQEDYVTRNEVFSGVAGFLASSLILSSVRKYFVIDDLCLISKSSEAIGVSPNLFSEGGVCKGIFQTWVSTFGMDPFYNIFFWLIVVAGAIVAVLIYRKYGE